MVLKALKGKNPILLILIPGIAFLLWLKAFTNPQPIVTYDTYMPLYDLLVEICGGSQFWLNLLGFALLILTAFGLMQLNEKYIFFKQRTDLPALVFVLIATGTLALQGMHPAIPAGFFLLLAMERIFGIYHGSSTISYSFDAGLCIGLATLFYLNVAPYLLWFCFSLAILGFFRGREIMAGLLGFLTPIFCAFGWYFWNDRLPQLMRVVEHHYKHPGMVSYISPEQWIHWGFMMFLVLFASFFMLNVYEEKKISSRKYLHIILWFFLFCIFSYFLFPSSGMEWYLLAAIPVTYLASHYFVLQKHRWMGDIMFLLLLLVSVAVHFMG